jgi:hypothetical protein
MEEIALTEAEIDEILQGCGTKALLVGGQALAFWAQHFQIAPAGVLASHVTYDVDFVGGLTTARELAKQLKSAGWRLHAATFDDATVQTAKLSKRVEGEGIKQVDFLSGIAGLNTERIQSRAVLIRLAGGELLKVLHPLDVLESRLQNLALLPSKRNPHGVAQAKLAVEMAGAFLQQCVRAGSKGTVLQAIERVFDIAQNKRLAPVFHDHGFDLLAIVPADEVTSEPFRAKRWPQIQAHIAQLRAAYASRREQLDRRKASARRPK